MAYYTLTSGSYSDYRVRATLIGPEDVDLPKMLADWVDHGPFAPGSDALDPVRAGLDALEAFIAYIGKLPGWEELFPTEFSLGSYEPDGWDEYMDRNKGKWPPEPEQGPEPCPKWPYRDYLPSHHSWAQGRDAQGRCFWGCAFCGKEAPGGQET